MDFAFLSNNPSGLAVSHEYEKLERFWMQLFFN